MKGLNGFFSASLLGEEISFSGMVILNEELLRKRSEHNDGILADLQEISLHQHEIERIECVGKLCKHLKILLLQNNIIAKMENLHKLKELEYLNLALNNIELIENISGCESLRKLDLTVNFIDFDALEESLSNLQDNYNLEDLYLLGNPVMSEWGSKCRDYVVGRLPQLKQLDGELVTPAGRITARSRLQNLEEELNLKKMQVSERKHNGIYETGSFTRQARIEMYRELGEQKAEKERADRVRMGIPEPRPRKELISVMNAQGEIRQCNQGGYEYSLRDESGVCVIFELRAPKYLDISLIEVDLHPTYIRCVVKSKVTQVRFEEEIVVSESKIQRSLTTGVLKCTCPYESRKRCVKDTMPRLEFIN